MDDEPVMFLPCKQNDINFLSRFFFLFLLTTKMSTRIFGVNKSMAGRHAALKLCVVIAVFASERKVFGDKVTIEQNVDTTPFAPNQRAEKKRGRPWVFPSSLQSLFQPNGTLGLRTISRLPGL